MALLFADGFDHYGNDETNMLDGTYATASRVTLSTSAAGAPPATGTHCLRIDDSESAASSLGIRKVLPSAKDKMGAIARFYFPDFPPDVGECAIFDFVGASVDSCQVTCIVDPNGALRFYRGSNGGSIGSIGTLIAQTDPIIVTSAWNHIEVQVYIHDTDGWIRVAVNGVHRFQAENLDTKHSTANIVSVAIQRYEVSVQDGEFYVDDFQLYDFVGDSGVDTDWVPTTDGSGVATGYIGELQCMYLPPNADTAEDDWVPSTGSDAYAMVDETTPNDADYISATAVDDLTEMALTDLPAEITYIRGLMLIGRMSKSDSGTAMTKFGMKSVADTSDAAERPITVEPTYWWDFINVDPDSGARWTRASLNAAWIRLIRSV